jgi:hypothetical protein
MRIPRIIAQLLLLASLAGCENPTASLQLDGPLAVRAGARTLQLRNQTAETVHVFVIERESAALTNWAPCSNPDRCDGLAPGEEQSIGYGEIAGYESGDQEAILYWWHLEQQPGGGFAPDSIRAEVIRL